MTWLEEQQEFKRNQLEEGRGGDRDTPYRYRMNWLTHDQLRGFIVLMRRFLDGDIGGRDDGVILLPAPENPEGTNEES